MPRRFDGQATMGRAMPSTKANADRTLRIVRPDNAAAALGMAVNHLMMKSAFANLRFGDWSRILVGQINRKHFCFVVDADDRVQGFMGWALASEEHALAWAEGTRALTFEDSCTGDCIVLNAFSANSTRVTRFMVEEARRIAKDKAAIYFKRHYKNGTRAPHASRSIRSSRPISIEAQNGTP